MSAYSEKVSSIGGLGLWEIQESDGAAELADAVGSLAATIGGTINLGEDATWPELNKAGHFTSGYARILDGVAGGHDFSDLGGSPFWVSFLFRVPSDNAAGDASSWWPDDVVIELRREASGSSQYDVVFSIGLEGNKVAIGRSLSGSSSRAVFSQTVADNAWHFAFIQVTDTDATLHLDTIDPEVLALGSGGATMGTNAANMAIGGRQRDTGTIDSNYFNGWLSGVAVGSGAVSRSDILDLLDKAASRNDIGESSVSGIVLVDAQPAARVVRAYSYYDVAHQIDGVNVSESKSLGQTVSNAANGRYTVNLSGAFDGPVFVVAFDDYGLDFQADNAVSLGDRYHPSVPNGYVYECIGAGSLPSSEPSSWPIDTSVSHAIGSASFEVLPFYRPMVHGPIFPKLNIQENLAGDPYWDYVWLLIHADLDDDLGSTIKDYSPYDRTVTKVSGVEVITTELSGFGEALDFAGSTDALTVAGMDIPTYTPFTIEAIVRVDGPNALGRSHCIWSHSNSGANGEQQVLMTDGGNISIDRRSGHPSECRGGTSTGDAYTPGEIVRVAHCFDGSQHRFYIDGDLKYSISDSLGWNGGASQNFQFGFNQVSSYTDYRNPLNGFMDEIRVTVGVCRYSGQSYTVADAPFDNFKRALTLSEEILLSQPSAYYKFNDEDGLIAEDASGGANHAAYDDSPTLGEPSLTYGAGFSVYFPGDTNARVTTPFTVNINDVYSIEFIIKPESAGEGGFGRLISCEGSGGWGLYPRADDPQALTLTSSVTGVTFNAGKDLLDVVTHGVLVSSGSGYSLYIDGVLADTASSISGADSVNPLMFGNRPALDRGFNGWIDDSAIYVGKELSAEEVLNHFVSMPWEPIDMFAGGEIGAVYDISDTATLFQDIGGTVPATADGDPVALVVDKRASGYNARQTDTSKRPIYRTDGIHHWLESDGTQYLTITGTAADFSFCHSGAGATIMGAFQPAFSADPNAGYGFIGNVKFTSTAVGFAIGYDDRASVSRSDNLLYLVGRNSAGNPVIPNPDITDQVDPLSACVVGARFGISESPDFEFYNGKSVAYSGDVSVSPVTSSASHDIDIFAAGDGSSIQNGKFYGAVIINRVVSDSELLRLTHHLANASGAEV